MGMRGCGVISSVRGAWDGWELGLAACGLVGEG